MEPGIPVTSFGLTCHEATSGRAPIVTVAKLEARPDAAGKARRLVASALDAAGLTALADVALLMTSEVVTNACLLGGPHAFGGAIELRIDTTGGAVRVEVHDHNLALPAVGDGEGMATSGRGMFFVAALADRWGTTPKR